MELSELLAQKADAHALSYPLAQVVTVEELNGERDEAAEKSRHTAADVARAELESAKALEESAIAAAAICCKSGRCTRASQNGTLDQEQLLDDDASALREGRNHANAVWGCGVGNCWGQEALDQMVPWSSQGSLWK